MQFKFSEDVILETLPEVSVRLSHSPFTWSFAYLRMRRYEKNKVGYKQTESRAFYLNDMPIEMRVIAETIGSLQAVLARYMEAELAKEFSDSIIDD